MNLVYRGIVLLAIVFSTPIFSLQLKPKISYYPEEFYIQVKQGLNNTELRESLFKILSLAHLKSPNTQDEIVTSCPKNASQNDCQRHTALTYSNARRALFGQLFLLETTRGYGLKCIYCQYVLTENDFPSGKQPGPDQIPDNNVINTEHAWPQSLFSQKFSKKVQKSDLHILFPAIPIANSARNNHSYAFVDSKNTSSPCPGAKLGHVGGQGKILFFEPPDVSKGDVARAVFYFATRYQMPIDEIEEVALRQWNTLDPIDDEERTRNNSILEYQGNRNPFVDYPELVNQIADF